MPSIRCRAGLAGSASAVFIAVALVSAALACCENHRHAVAYLPVAMCLGAVFLRDVAAAARRITPTRPFR